jgi:uncharacterized damage-inducible protein DinB
MFTCKGILQLHSWTHNSLDVLLGHCASMPFRLLTTAVPGFGVKTVRNQLVHTIGNEYYWVWKLMNPQSADPPWDDWRASRFSSVAKIEAARVKVRAHTIAYLKRMKDSQLHSEIVLSSPGMGSETGSRAFYLHHALTHHFHHKGQVAAMCRILGHPCPETDLRCLPPVVK